MNSMFITGTALAVAAATLYGAMRWIWGRNGKDSARFGLPDPDVQVLSRTRVGIGRTLVVVEVEGRRLLLGSTQAQWCALADLGTAKSRGEEETLEGIDAELARAVQATRYRRGWKHS
jgi:flagellar biogenesis protein FliO